MADDNAPVNRLLDPLLRQRGMEDPGICRHRHVAKLFDTTVRTIQAWEADPSKGLKPRDLPNGGRYLSEDLEEFLRASGTEALARTAKHHRHFDSN
jgi:hypothetical protein